MAHLSAVAEKAKDLYFQDYAPRTAFFDLNDFKFHCAAIYSQMLNAMFQQMRKEGKAETSFANVEINPQWLIKQDFKDIKFDEGKKMWYVETDQPIFSFDFDAFANGLNEIRPYKQCLLKKISTNELRFQDTIPKTSDVYYYLEGNNRIEFTAEPCKPITAYYIPQVLSSDDNCVMSDSIVPDLITGTLKLMFGAKNGNVVQELDNGNENPTLANQTIPVK